jgi:FdhD protein
MSRDGDDVREREDSLAVEEPLEIRLQEENGGSPEAFVVTMRTPGEDEDLSAGLLFAEGVLATPADLCSLRRSSDPRMESDMRENVLIATVRPEAVGRARALRRSTVMGSACGVCGRTSIDAILPAGRPPLTSPLRVAAEVLYGLPDKLRESQSVFSRTGGLHAAALFDATGSRLAVREDIGRHNATDKLVGRLFRDGAVPAGDRILMVSGRAGFEIVQKAYNAGIPVVASVSAPSSLAVELADAGGVTLVGFLRERRFNVYSHSRRVLGGDPAGIGRDPKYRIPVDRS